MCSLLNSGADTWQWVDDATLLGGVLRTQKQGVHNSAVGVSVLYNQPNYHNSSETLSQTIFGNIKYPQWDTCDQTSRVR